MDLDGPVPNIYILFPLGVSVRRWVRSCTIAESAAATGASETYRLVNWIRVDERIYRPLGYSPAPTMIPLSAVDRAEN